LKEVENSINALTLHSLLVININFYKIMPERFSLYSLGELEG
jgi:hypothetical protein